MVRDIWTIKNSGGAEAPSLYVRVCSSNVFKTNGTFSQAWIKTGHHNQPGWNLWKARRHNHLDQVSLVLQTLQTHHTLAIPTLTRSDSLWIILTHAHSLWLTLVQADSLWLLTHSHSQSHSHSLSQSKGTRKTHAIRKAPRPNPIGRAFGL